MSRAALVILLLTISAAGVAAQSERVLLNIQNGADGRNPYAPVLRDSAGNLYGTTSSGGTNFNAGTVYELTP